MLYKMKGLTLLVLGTLIFGISGYLIKVPTIPSQPRVGPETWIHLQKLILPLFENVCEASSHPIIVRLAQGFTLDNPSGVYLNADAFTNFEKYNVKGFLPKGEIFTNFDVEHKNQLKILYELFLYAKDFDTFYKAAAWARQNVNCGLFVNAIYLAILNRRDTEKLSVPAPYELLPNYFIQKDVILKASALLSGEEVVLSETVRDEGNSYILDANYTADFFENDSELKLSYFHEDIGLNSYNFLQRLKRSPWFNTAADLKINYGEYFYHMIKQLSARYSLERYANNLPEVEDISYNNFIAAPYDPSLIYSNGKEFGHRTRMTEMTNADDVELSQTIENNIATVVAHMMNTGYNKSEILNHLIDILVTGERSFETLLISSIGKDVSFSQPSVLQHYMTSMRDPIFWKLNQKLVNLVDQGLKNLPAYTRNELYFPGIEVVNIDVKKVMTYFDYFQFDVTDALKTTAMNITFQVKIGQPRLNHKAFAVKINVSSLVSQKGLLKLYLGPKVAPGEFILKKNLFVLLDSFEYNFKIGSNIISRSSDEMSNFSGDFTSFRTFWKNIENAEFGFDIVPFVNAESLSQFPSRLLLPRGTPEGIPLQIFVFVAPFVKSSFTTLSSLPTMEFNSAILSPGYPLDLKIEDSQLLNLPNSMVKDVLITHKGDKVSNYGGNGVTSKWQKEDYAGKTKEPFDYSSKKGQYGPKEDYSEKKKETFDYSANTNQYETLEDVPKRVDVDKNTFQQEIIKRDSNVNSPVREFSDKKQYYNEKLIKSEPSSVEEPQKYDSSQINQSFQILRETFTKKPSVYDYIHHDDYYDTYDVVSKVYE